MVDNLAGRLEAAETRMAALEVVFAEIVRAAFMASPDGNARLTDAIDLAKETIRVPSGYKPETFNFCVNGLLENLAKPPANH